MNFAIARDQWAPALNDFSRRNAGRATALEEDDEAFGAQSQESGLRLRGLTYDPKKDEVEIMLDVADCPTEHLTHMVAGVSGIDVERLINGDVAIRIAHGEDQTLLRFTDASAGR